MQYYAIWYKSSNGNKNTDYAYTRNFLFNLLDDKNIIRVDWHKSDGNIKQYYPKDFNLLRKECTL